jgi:hypothetical protein
MQLLAVTESAQKAPNSQPQNPGVLEHHSQTKFAAFDKHHQHKQAVWCQLANPHAILQLPTETLIVPEPYFRL